MIEACGLAICEVFFRWERISAGVMSSSMGRLQVSAGGGLVVKWSAHEKARFGFVWDSVRRVGSLYSFLKKRW